MRTAGHADGSLCAVAAAGGTGNRLPVTVPEKIITAALIKDFLSTLTQDFGKYTGKR